MPAVACWLGTGTRTFFFSALGRSHQSLGLRGRHHTIGKSMQQHIVIRFRGTVRRWPRRKAVAAQLMSMCRLPLQSFHWPSLSHVYASHISGLLLSCMHNDKLSVHSKCLISNSLPIYMYLCQDSWDMLFSHLYKRKHVENKDLSQF